MNKLFIFLLFLFSVCPLIRACETGYACSIDKLKEEQIINYDTIKENKVEDYRNNEKLLFSDMTKKINYTDLFIYKNSIYQINKSDK